MQEYWLNYILLWKLVNLWSDDFIIYFTVSHISFQLYFIRIPNGSCLIYTGAAWVSIRWKDTSGAADVTYSRPFNRNGDNCSRDYWTVRLIEVVAINDCGYDRVKSMDHHWNGYWSIHWCVQWLIVQGRSYIVFSSTYWKWILWFNPRNEGYSFTIGGDRVWDSR